MAYAPFLHNVDGADHARAFRVSDAGGNNISVAAGRVRIDQTVTNYAAPTALGPLPNGTNYIYIDNAGNITSNLGGPYPVNSVPLARVVVAAGDITGITDDRCFFYEDTAAGGGAPHNLLDGATHPDTVAQAVSVGSLPYGNNMPLWDELVRVVPGAPALRNVLGFDQGDTVPAWKATLDGVNPAPIGVAAPGVSLISSHRDHVHAHPGALGANLHHNEAHAAAQHNAAVLTAGFNENLGAFYLDIDDIAVPANPGVGVRRLFTNTVTGELSVRTNAGATVSLEGAGGGGTLDAAYDFGGAGAGRIITVDSGAVRLDGAAGVPLLQLVGAGGPALQGGAFIGTGLVLSGPLGLMGSEPGSLGAIWGRILCYDESGHAATAGTTNLLYWRSTQFNPAGSNRNIRNWYSELLLVVGDYTNLTLVGWQQWAKVVKMAGGVAPSTVADLTCVQWNLQLSQLHEANALTITSANGLRMMNPTWGGAAGPCSVGTWRHIDIQGLTNMGVWTIGLWEAIYITDPQDANIAVTRLLELGPAGAPYLRLVGGANPPAFQTNLWLKEAANLRQVRWMDPGAGGANFVGGERVMILV